MTSNSTFQKLDVRVVAKKNYCSGILKNHRFLPFKGNIDQTSILKNFGENLKKTKYWLVRSLKFRGEGVITLSVLYDCVHLCCDLNVVAYKSAICVQTLSKNTKSDNFRATALKKVPEALEGFQIL